MEITEKQLEEWKLVLHKDGITYKSDEEYKAALKNLAGFFDVLIQIDKSQKQDNPS